jgi:uncharacterized protein (DUF924 family)
MIVQIEDVNRYWLEEVGPDGWYQRDDARDAEIKHRFERAWRVARSGAYDHWTTSADGCLALLILLDQFPRNMFRGEDMAFKTDRKALCVAKAAIKQSMDLKIPEPQRQFFYLPLMHSESLVDQERCVRLFATRMPETGNNNMPFAVEHRDVIRRFGRFPYRNAALGRRATPAEEAYLAEAAYPA